MLHHYLLLLLVDDDVDVVYFVVVVALLLPLFPLQFCASWILPCDLEDAPRTSTSEKAM